METQGHPGCLRVYAFKSLSRWRLMRASRRIARRKCSLMGFCVSVANKVHCEFGLPTPSPCFLEEYETKRLRGWGCAKDVILKDLYCRKPSPKTKTPIWRLAFAGRSRTHSQLLEYV